MPSIDVQFVRNRQREIRRYIHRSSPALLYSGSLGIVIIAPSKKAQRSRIGRILDRLAIVSRGEITACDHVHEVAALAARTRAHYESKEDVRGSDAARAISDELSKHYHAIFGPTLAVESCLVQLNETPETDYMAHIEPDGSVQTIDRIHFMGTIGTDEGTEHDARESVKKFNEELETTWKDVDSVDTLLSELKPVPELHSLFAPGKRCDVVLLRRQAFLQKKYDRIFERLTIA